jgi:hypothetical protein
MDPADPDSIASAVRSLCEAPEELARFRANAEEARKVLNWEQEERIIAAILGGRPAGKV